MSSATKLNCKILMWCTVFSFFWCMLTVTCANFLNEYQVGDFSIFSALGMSVEKGLVLFRDVFDHKGPLQFFIYAFAHHTGYFKFAIFLMEVFACAIDLFCIYKIVSLFRLSSLRIYPLIAFPFLLYATSGGGGRPETFSLPMTFVAMYLVMKYVKEDRFFNLRQWFIMGIFIGMHAMLKANNGIITCCLLLSFIILNIYKTKIARLIKITGALMTGAFIAFFPFYLYFLYHDSVFYFLDATFLHNFKYATDPVENGSSKFWLNMFINTLPTYCSLFFAYKIYNRANKKLLFVMLFVILGGTLNMGLGKGFFYYYLSYIPVIILFIIIGIIYFLNTKNRLARFVIILTCGVSMINFEIAAIRLVPYTFCFNFYPQGHEKTRNCVLQVTEAEQLRRCIPITDYYSFWAYDVLPQIYPLSGMVPSIRYCLLQSFQGTTNKDIQNYISNKLLTDPPKWIAVPYNVKYREGRIDVGHQDLTMLLNKEYELYEEFPNGLKASLFRRKSNVAKCN